MHRLIVDTNVVVSSLLGKSYPHKIIFDLFFENKVALYISSEIMNEYRGVLLRKKFIGKAGFQNGAQKLLECIRDTATVVRPRVRIELLIDKSDDMFLELALSSQADFLITGNSKHFPFKQFENTRILSPKEYWDKYWK